MIILLVIVIVVYLILAIIFRDKTISHEVADEVMEKAVIDYLAKRKLSMPSTVVVNRMPNWSQSDPDLYQKERIKRIITKHTRCNVR
jgi:hypothetical protein